MRGVRNNQARNNLAAMRAGEKVLFYHSQQELAVVGVCEVEREAFPDPTSSGSYWLAAGFRPVKTLTRPVPLSLIKNVPELRQIGLVRQPRLSVMRLSKEQYESILKNAVKNETQE